jgi:hypothetical protein
VFTVCDNAAKEVCPIWPGQSMTAHWGLPDPVKAEGSEAERHLAFADALRMLSNRIGIFVSLPFDKSSKLSLQQKLDEIGRTESRAGERAGLACSCDTWPPSQTQRAPRVDKDRRPSYVSRAAASLAFFGRFPPVLCEAGRNGSMTLRSGAFAPQSKSHL